MPNFASHTSIYMIYRQSNEFIFYLFSRFKTIEPLKLTQYVTWSQQDCVQLYKIEKLVKMAFNPPPKKTQTLNKFLSTQIL